MTSAKILVKQIKRLIDSKARKADVEELYPHIEMGDYGGTEPSAFFFRGNEADKGRRYFEVVRKADNTYCVQHYDGSNSWEVEITRKQHALLLQAYGRYKQRVKRRTGRMAVAYMEALLASKTAPQDAPTKEPPPAKPHPWSRLPVRDS
jgi:hypothetical protein